MSRYHSYLQTAATILSSYNGGEPFANYLKKQLAASGKYGSTDRKQIAHFCYSYFRLGRSFLSQPIQDRIITGLFLCADSTTEALSVLKPDWADQVHLNTVAKLNLLKEPSAVEQIFPFLTAISEGIEPSPFSKSHLIQPNLFLRIRPGNHQKVLNDLSAAGIPYKLIGDHCIALPNGTNAANVLAINTDVVVQDYSSQSIGKLVEMSHLENTVVQFWDCCAASGGKSILVADLLNQVHITVSDIRESILANLRKRFSEAGLKQYRSFVKDLAAVDANVRSNEFDFIWADVPCSGSGTWSRTPEQLLFFREGQLKEYAQLQKRIVKTAELALKKKGYFLYSTCSVYRQENEEVVAYLLQECPLQLLEMQILKGYEHKADTMFAALFQKLD